MAIISAPRCFITVLILFLAILTANAQIPNAGFESWTSGTPDGWKTNNLGPTVFISQSSDAHGGSSAAHGAVNDVGFGFTLGPVLSSAGNSADGFPVSQRYTALHLYYKLTVDSGDGFNVNIGLTKLHNSVGAGVFSDNSSSSTYKEAVVPITYQDSTSIPDTAYIAFTISPLTGCHIGSSFTVDDLSFESVTAIEGEYSGIPKEMSLHQNFPNPFNPTTKITYDLPRSSMVCLTVCDILGREVAALVNEHQTGGRYWAEFDATALTSGIYFYTLEAEGVSRTNKMMIMK